MKRSFLVCLLTLCLVSPVFASFNGPGAPSSAGSPSEKQQQGFQGPRKGHITKAAEVNDAWDDTPVVLEGHLVEQVSADNYTFQDASGKVVVDIDDELFYDLGPVTPQTLVRLYGEVDSHFARASEVDVDRLEVVR